MSKRATQRAGESDGCGAILGQGHAISLRSLAIPVVLLLVYPVRSRGRLAISHHVVSMKHDGILDSMHDTRYMLTAELACQWQGGEGAVAVRLG